MSVVLCHREEPLLAEAAVRPVAPLEQAVREEHHARARGQRDVHGRPAAHAGQQPERHAALGLHPGHVAALAQQQAGVARAQDLGVPLVGREDQGGDGGEHVGVRALGDEDLLQQRDLLGLGRTAQDGGTPGHPQADAERGLGRAVPGDIADHRVHGAVRGLHDVVEVPAEEPVDPSRLVPGTGVEPVVPQQRDGQQTALQAGVLLGDQPVGAQGRRCPFHFLALEGVADRAREDLGAETPLDQVVLGAAGDRAEPGPRVLQAGQDDDRGLAVRLQDLAHRVQPVDVGEVQIEEHADRRGGGVQESAGLGQRLAPGEGGVQLAVGEHLLDEQRVTRVVLDQQDRGVDVPQRGLGPVRYADLLGDAGGAHRNR